MLWIYMIVVEFYIGGMLKVCKFVLKFEKIIYDKIVFYFRVMCLKGY